MTETAGSTAARTTAGWEDGELVITRAFDAPRELVLAAWTQPGHFARWFGPRGSTLEVRALDARPGGALHYRHHLPNGEEVWIAGVYHEVAAPGRIAWTTYFSDAEGNRVPRPAYPEAEGRITVAFAEEGGGTRVTARHAGLPGDRGEVEGWTESLDRLESHLANA